MFFRLMTKIIGFLKSGTSMAMASLNMNLIGVFVTKLWPVQALACGGGGDGGGGATKTIISPKFSNFWGYNYIALIRSSGSFSIYNPPPPSLWSSRGCTA